VPSGATTGKIKVTNPAGRASSVATFFVLPQITGFTPASGLAGTIVTINGTTFNNASSVQFNGLAATFSLNSSTKITATVPSGATTGKISVTTAGGAGNSTTSFMVLPTITSFTPKSGPVSTKVDHHRHRLHGVSKVRFNGKDAGSVTVDSPTQITASVNRRQHNGQDHRHDVGGHGHQREQLHRDPAADGDRVQPGSGVPGTPWSSPGPTSAPRAGDLQQHHDDGLLDQLPTQITVNVPSGATTGKIKVTNPAGRASSVASFLVPPQITSFRTDVRAHRHQRHDQRQ
jgi:hypothetical protein